MYGYIESDLRGVSEYVAPKTTLPSKYDMKNQMDSPCDQGNRGICVSVCVSNMCDYLFRGQGKRWQNGLDYFYNKRQYKNIDGMSPRDAFEIAQKDNFIKSFAKVGNIDSVKHAILANGPVLIALPVYNTARDNFWEKYHGEDCTGGHAVTLVGFDNKGFALRNSWGVTYGDNGYGFFPFDNLKDVLEAWTIII